MINLMFNKLMTISAIWMKRHAWLLSILLLNLLIRLAFITLFTHWDESGLMDSSRYLRVAMNILHKRGFTEWSYPSAFSPPLYPLFMAGIFRIFGMNTIIIKVIQILLNVLTSVWIYLIGSTVFNRRVGLLSAFGIAINPDIIVMSGSLYTETLYIFLSCLTFACLVYALRFPRKTWAWWLTGIMMGLSILTRHIMILYPIMMLGTVVIFSSLHVLRRPVIHLSLACYLLLIPWTVRNYVIFDQFVPVASGAGGGLWHGSDTSNGGRYQYDLSKQVILEETKGSEGQVEKDRVLLDKSIKTIARSPMVFLGMTVKRFLRFFTQVYEDVPQGNARQLNPAIMTVLVVSYYPVLIFCVFGGILSIRQWRILFPFYWIIIYSGMIYSIMMVIPRYRIPLLPFMILFGCVGIDKVFQHYLSRYDRSILSRRAIPS